MAAAITRKYALTAKGVLDITEEGIYIEHPEQEKWWTSKIYCLISMTKL